jgi:CO/xanthine dehydrogenase FAD-binding subunit
MTTTQIAAYHRPRNLDEAWGLLGRADPTMRAVSGGTDLTIACPPEVTALVDLAGAVSASIETRDGGEIEIGAMATLSRMAENPAVAAHATGVIPEMLEHVGSPLLRNVCTIGGHLARGKLSDVIPVLLAVDASVTIHTGEPRRVSLADYYELGLHEQPHVLTAVHLPALAAPCGAAFERFSRTAFDFPMANCCCRVGGDIRIVVGATPQRGRRATEAEAILAAGGLDPPTLAAAAALAAAETPTGSSWVVSAEYRRQLVAVLVRRSLETAVTRLGA